MKNDFRDIIVNLRLFRPIFHFLFVILSYFVVYNIRFYTDLVPYVQLRIPYIDFNETIIFSIIAWICIIIIWILLWVYELFKPIHWYYKKFFYTSVIWIVIMSFIAYFWHWFLFVNWISRFILVWWSIFSFFMISFFDFFYNYINSYFEKKSPYRVLFIYSNEKLFHKIIKLFDSYKIYIICGENISDLKDNLRELKNYDIIVSIWNIHNELLQDIVDKIRLYGKTFYNISETYFLEDLIYIPETFGPILAFEHKPSPLDGWDKVFKRWFDIIFSSLFILFFFWVYLIIWLFIYFKDWSPVIYMSWRTWRWWHWFYMYKFRSMVKNADDIKDQLKDKNERKWPLFKISNDPRISWWWKILRKTSLDEIPQMVNVLIWDMSIVWPRPHLPEEVENYKWWHKRLLSIKPWITWYAQVFGRDKLEFDEEAKLDLYYIQNWNMFLDIYVIVNTFKVIFSWR